MEEKIKERIKFLLKFLKSLIRGSESGDTFSMMKKVQTVILKWIFLPLAVTWGYFVFVSDTIPSWDMESNGENSWLDCLLAAILMILAISSWLDYFAEKKKLFLVPVILFTILFTIIIIYILDPGLYRPGV